jgi:acyl-CoA synthetase (AMP-forming)/AMP-acid ligase II
VKTAAPSPDATPISAKTPVRALIEERASQHGESTFLLMARSDQRVTFAQLRERIDQWRDVLDAQGLRSGDSIALVIGEPVALAND